MLDLKNQCIDPSTQKPYIKSLTGGINNSPEGRNNGYHYGYVVEFASAEDRDYYLNEDPATQAFFKVATPVIQKFQTLDYEAGVFR